VRLTFRSRKSKPSYLILQFGVLNSRSSLQRYTITRVRHSQISAY